MPRLRTLRHRIGFRPHVLDTVLEGVPCTIHIADPTAAAWYSGGQSRVSPEMRFVHDSLLRPGARVFEIGGHHGCTAMVLARLIPGARRRHADRGHGGRSRSATVAPLPRPAPADGDETRRGLSVIRRAQP